MKTVLAVLTALTLSACSSTSVYDDGEPTTPPTVTAGYEARYDYNVEHTPDLDRQLLIRDKLKATVCEGGGVKTFSVIRNTGYIKCNNNAFMRFDVDKVKVNY